MGEQGGLAHSDTFMFCTISEGNDKNIANITTHITQTEEGSKVHLNIFVYRRCDFPLHQKGGGIIIKLVTKLNHSIFITFTSTDAHKENVLC